MSSNFCNINKTLIPSFVITLLLIAITFFYITTRSFSLLPTSVTLSRFVSVSSQLFHELFLALTACALHIALKDSLIMQSNCNVHPQHGLNRRLRHLHSRAMAFTPGLSLSAPPFSCLQCPDLDLTKTVPWRRWVCVPSFVWIGPANWPTVKHRSSIRDFWP